MIDEIDDTNRNFKRTRRTKLDFCCASEVVDTVEEFERLIRKDFIPRKRTYPMVWARRGSKSSPN